MSDTAGSNIATTMGPWQLFWSRAYRRWVRLSRYIPHLVWRNDEVDVCVTFTADRLPHGIDGEEALRELYSGPIAEIERQLSRLGVGFDKGMGFEGRDWEWDWSLSGPISVKFRSRAKKPERRASRNRKPQGERSSQEQVREKD